MVAYPARVKQSGEYLFLQFIDLPGAFTQAQTMDELMENAVDVLSATIQVMIAENMEIPQPSSIEGDDIRYIKPSYRVILPVLLKRAREQAHLNQKDVARRMGIEYQQYQKIERGKTPNITITTLEKAAKALGRDLTIDF